MKYPPGPQPPRTVFGGQPAAPMARALVWLRARVWQYNGAVSQSMAQKRTPRRRDPERTREAILEAAREVLAQDGKEGLSVAQVAQRAGVNRGTAYQHFQTRDELLEATAAWVSDKLYEAVFGEAGVASAENEEKIVETVNRQLVNFAMENPALGRIWLFQVLSGGRQTSDAFWRTYESTFKQFAETDLAQPGLDPEVLSLLFIAGAFIWPAWAGSRARTAKQREELADRFSREILRLSLHGTLRPEKYPDLEALVAKGNKPPHTKKKRS